MNDVEIVPFLGFGRVLLGMTRDQVAGILGPPAEVVHESFGEGEGSNTAESWSYPDLGVELSFGADDAFLLGTITFEAHETSLRGWRPLQQSDESLRAWFREQPDLDLELEDEFAELGARDYWCEQLGLMFWVEAERVTRVTLFARYVDDEPRWPDA